MGSNHVEPKEGKKQQQYANEVSIQKRSYLLNEEGLREKKSIFGISEHYSIYMPSMESQTLHIRYATICNKRLRVISSKVLYNKK